MLKSKPLTDLKVSRDARLLFVAGFQSGHIVGQVDVHLFVNVRATLVARHPQVYHVVRGRRAGLAIVVVVDVIGGHVLLLLLRNVDAVPAVHVLLDLGRYERAQPLGLRRRDELNAAGGRAAAMSLAIDAATAAAVLLHQVVAVLLQLLLMVQLLLVLQVQLVRGGVQQRVVTVMLDRRLLQMMVR